MTDWTDVDEEYRQEVKAKRIVTHPDYSGTAENDIAIILLEEDLEFNDKVRAVHSIAEEDWIDGYEGNAWVFGWGGTEVEREGVRVIARARRVTVRVRKMRVRARGEQEGM